MNPKPPPGLSAISWELLRLGAVAFGGLGATLALLQRGLVERRQWLQERDISEALAFTQALPGSTGIQVVAYLGWRLRGWPGALAAAVAFIAPATALMIAVAAASLALPQQPWVQGALTGVQVAVVGLVAAAMWRLARSNARGPMLTAMLLASCVLGFFVHAVIIVVGAGLLGVLFGAERTDE
jgi:chromate transporter